MKCIACNGKGTITPAKTRYQKKEGNALIAKALRTQGKSLREIQRIMGYKNVNSITHLLKSEK